MRFRPALTTAVLAAGLAGTLVVSGCAVRADDDGAAGTDAEAPAPAAASSATTEPVVAIADDFPLAAGMGGPDDVVPTSRTGTGLRDLALCGTTPLRGLDARDRMVADNSGGESANTRELVLLDSADEAAAVAEAVAGLPARCSGVEVIGETEVTTEVRTSPFGPAPAATLVQTYAFDGEPGPGATVVHVVPVGAALLVSSTYGQWDAGQLEAGIAATRRPLRRTVAAMAAFDGVPVGVG
ncbi:hypothetical protein SAMN04489844_2513 [Nocardioides exalbidus]|uniref:PknH-like extracellular domain-containing protein n=1 Tax=Nocardioides exalbidus TaxID=402596 RepID=A0A1H4TGI5_9ACTN|nr:hypothetical protein [Nocardioides exalbidus]SEC55439.1 hypothetical protein SAMN04489844_2513 [Nocardioides exalbidus]